MTSVVSRHMPGKDTSTVEAGADNQTVLFYAGSQLVVAIIAHNASRWCCWHPLNLIGGALTEVGGLGWAPTFAPYDTNWMVPASVTTRPKCIVQYLGTNIQVSGHPKNPVHTMAAGNT